MSLFGKILEKLGLRKDQDDEPESKGTAGAMPGKPSGTAPKTPANPRPAGTARTTTTTGGTTARTTSSRSTGGASGTTSGVGRGTVNEGSARQPGGTSTGTSTAARNTAGGTVSQPTANAPKSMSQVDVMNMLEQKARGTGLNWKQSISDLLFLLDLDNSREARKELAAELNAPAEVMGDSARMNTWLHKEVLRRIADNGGNIPRELLDD